jgi:hypothetical protein
MTRYVEKAALAARGLDLPGHTGPHRSRRATDQWAHIDDRQPGRTTQTCHQPILPDMRTTDCNEVPVCQERAIAEYALVIP